VLRKIIYLLVGGFVVISIAVAVIPQITTITVSDNTSQIPAVAAVGLNMAKWLIPLGVGFLVVMMGIGAFATRRRRRGRR
jgi:type II secretory pathway component PulF